MLSIIEGEVLGSGYIRQLLALVDDAPNDTPLLIEKRDRLQKEISNLLELVGAGTPASTVAPKIAEREAGIRDVEARLRKPRVPKLSTTKLRAALEQRAAEWKAELRAEPHIARMVLRRVVGPIVLHDDSERPEFVKWETEPTTRLLDGLATPPCPS